VWKETARKIILIWVLEKWVVNFTPGLGEMVEFYVNGNKRKKISLNLSRCLILEAGFWFIALVVSTYSVTYMSGQNFHIHLFSSVSRYSLKVSTQWFVFANLRGHTKWNCVVMKHKFGTLVPTPKGSGACCITSNPLTPELNPSAQRCLTRFVTGDFASRTVQFVNIRVKNQQLQQLFIQFINYVW
jgi:hypothetical protein